MKKSIILLLFISIFALTSCTVTEENITVQLPPLATYFLGLNEDLTAEQFSSFTGIASVREIEEDTKITIDNDISIRSDSLASGSRGGFAMGGFTPAIVFTEDSDDDNDPLTIE